MPVAAYVDIFSRSGGTVGNGRSLLVAANETAPPAAAEAKVETAKAPEPTQLQPAAKPAKKDGWLRRRLGLGKND